MLETENVMARNRDPERIPRLSMLRRVPTRYRSLLPLPVIKRYQCLVIGCANGVLTIAIPEQPDPRVLEFLRCLTGRPIFLVFVDAARMRLLIRRFERYAPGRALLCRRSYQMHIFPPLLFH